MTQLWSFCPSDSNWPSPIYLVPRKDGTFWMCSAYRTLNSSTVKDNYPIPHIQDFSHLLPRATGYWAVTKHTTKFWCTQRTLLKLWLSHLLASLNIAPCQTDCTDFTMLYWFPTFRFSILRVQGKKGACSTKRQDQRSNHHGHSEKPAPYKYQQKRCLLSTATIILHV